MKTYFLHTFADPDTGIQALQDVSQSIRDSLGGAKGIAQALATMALNTQYQPTGNGTGWGAPRLLADSYGARYITTGGLEYGWRVLWTSGAAPYQTDTIAGDVFIIGYPGGIARDGSTLAQSAAEHGWLRTEADPSEWDLTWWHLSRSIDKLAPQLLAQTQ